MTISRGRKSILLTVFAGFVALAAWAPKPAYALLGLDAGALTLWFEQRVYPPAIAGGLLQSRLNETIIGQTVGPRSGAALQIGEEQFRPAPGMYSSLVEYFENVWWQKFVRTSQVEAAELAKLMATQMAHSGRIASAGDIVGHKSKMEELSWLNDSDFLAGEVPLCSIVSQDARFLLDVLARQDTIKLDQESVGKRAGDPEAGSGPDASQGPSVYAIEAVKETAAAQTCAKGGNNGANEKWCPSSKPHLQGLHAMATTLLGQTALSSSPDHPSNRKYVDMFIERLFPNFFSPIRPDLLDPLSMQAAEVLQQQDAYKAGLSVFQYPYNSLVSENTPRSGIKAKQYLAASLSRIGVPQNAMEEILGTAGGDSVSKAGAERVIYQSYYSDPKTVIEHGSWNPQNLLRTIMVTNMQQVTLMYEVREQLKTTNALLGALGSMLTRDQYDDLQARTSAISAR